MILMDRIGVSDVPLNVASRPRTILILETCHVQCTLGSSIIRKMTISNPALFVTRTKMLRD